MSNIFLQIPTKGDPVVISNFRILNDFVKKVAEQNDAILKVTTTTVPAGATVKISADDRKADYLSAKLIASTGITLTQNHPGSIEDMTIAAHVPVTLATDHGLGLSGQTLNMGTPSTCTAVTTNAVTTTTHTHAVTGFLTAVTAHNILSVTHGDTTVSSPNENDVLKYSSGKWIAAAAAAGYSDEQAQDAVGGIFGNSLVYVDGTPSMDTVQDIRTSASPVFVTVKLSGLTDDYIPYHVDDTNGLANGPTKTNVDSAISLKHAAVTFGNYATRILTLTGQAITTPVTNANVVYAGPTSGAAAEADFRSIVLDDLPTITAAKGGTGQTSYTIGDLLYASASNALSKLADVAVLSYLASGGVGVAPSWLATNTAPVVEIAAAEPAGRDNGHLWYDSDGTTTGYNIDILMVEIFSGG